MTDDQTDTLQGIKLTKEGTTPVSKSIRIPPGERTELLAEPARATIIKLMREGIDDTITEERVEEETRRKIVIQTPVKRHALSVIELVNLSKKQNAGEEPLTKSQVYHHLPKLIESGYVVLYGTLTTGKRTTDYYRRTAELFVFESVPGGTEKARREKITKMIDAIQKHFDFTLTVEQKEQLRKLWLKATQIEHDTYVLILDRVTGDLADPDVVKLMSDIIMTYTTGSDEWVRLKRMMRKILFKEDTG